MPLSSAIDVCGVHEAPAFVDVDMVKEPLDRTLATERDALLDFAHLLGDVDVHGPLATQHVNGDELCGSDGAQAVGRHANHRVGQPVGVSRGGVDEPGEVVDSVDEPALVLARRHVTEIRVRIATRAAA